MALPFKKRVLIVEDDQEIRNSFSLIVNSSQKFMVINAYANCEDAIDNINRDKPEIVLMDIELPGMAFRERRSSRRKAHSLRLSW